MTRSRWIIFALLCLGILGLIVVISKKDNGATFKGDANKVITDGPIADHTFGSDQHKVVLIEYGDYQCPGCETAYPIIKELTQKYQDELTFIFRNLPLTTIHPNALAAATAAEAAGQQNKYYEYHDILYDNQDAWKDASVTERGTLFEHYAKQLGLDVNKFKTDLTSDAVTTKINRDRSTASGFGLTSTPSLILNGEKLSQDLTFDREKLKQAIDDELKKAGIVPPPSGSSTQNQ